MRARFSTAVVLGVLVAGFAATGSAQADTWCRNGTMCVFSSYQQCASAIRVSGGVCTREQSAQRFNVRSSARYAGYSSTPLPTNLHPSRFSCSNVN